MENLRNREQRCDTPISDYICDHFRKEHLFYSPNHPRTRVIYELFVRALRHISIPVDDACIPNRELDNHVLPIYPAVYRHLELEFDYPSIYWNTDLCTLPSNMLEYVSAYLHYCGRRILTDTTTKEILPYVAKELLIGERKSILSGAGASQIECGGISLNTNYKESTRILSVQGWYLPLSAYDEVQVYADSQFLGNADLYFPREDVYRNYPQYGEHRSGWKLERNIDLKLPCTVTAKCLKNGAVVRTDKKELKIFSS